MFFQVVFGGRLGDFYWSHGPHGLFFGLHLKSVVLSALGGVSSGDRIREENIKNYIICFPGVCNCAGIFNVTVGASGGLSGTEERCPFVQGVEEYLTF